MVSVLSDMSSGEPSKRDLRLKHRNPVGAPPAFGSRPNTTRPNTGTMICMALVALSLVLGGGGTVNPQAEMILQLSVAFMMVPLAVLPSWQRGLGGIRREAWLLAGLVLLVPVAQLIPLPPNIWHALPGRTIEVEALARAGADQRWMPISMAPARTFASLLAIMCPLLLMLQVSRVPLRERNWICASIVAIGGLSLLLGVLQLSHTGGLVWSFYNEISLGYLVGFQANRNAETDVLQAALLAFGVLITTRLLDGRNHKATWAGLALGVLALLVGVLMTGSRAGIALAPLTLGLLAVMLWPAVRSKRDAAIWLGGALVGFAALGLTFWQFDSVRRVADRFSVLHDARADIWADTIYASRQVWPVGSGIGTIVPMLEAAERLEVVDPTRPVRAHNDWLEWTMEAGQPGLFVLAGIVIWIGFLLVRTFRATGGLSGDTRQRTHAVFAGGVLLVLALHGIVDYPMRSMALASLAAVAVALLIEPTDRQRAR